MVATLATSRASNHTTAMKKIIIIGPCRMDIIMPADTTPGAPLTWIPGSALQNSAIILAQSGAPVWMVSEVARDAIGSLLCRSLESAGVNIQCIDRVSNGEHTSTAIFFRSETAVSPIIYSSDPDERFNASWPRIDPGDVVLFGSPELLKPRAHQFMSDLLDHIADRNAIAVYAPLLTPYEVPRITRATPVILEFMERADITLLTPTDTTMLFTDTEAEKCYNEHVRFYCPTMVYFNEATHTLSIHHHKLQATAPVQLPSHTLIWQAGAISALATALERLDISRPEPGDMLSFSIEQLQAMASIIADGADNAAQTSVINH